jgi:nicotinamide-nucleotide amidase
MTAMNPVLADSSAEMARAASELAGLLKERGLTISVAESCSGGLLAKMLTDLPGSSAFFLAGVVAYSNDAKSKFLSVPPDLIQHYGAVSSEVAEAMAAGALSATRSDLALSITGVAGPDGGTEEKPVGTVYLGLANSHDCNTMLLRLSGNRHQIRIASACNAINLLISHLHGTAQTDSKVHA